MTMQVIYSAVLYLFVLITPFAIYFISIDEAQEVNQYIINEYVEEDIHVILDPASEKGYRLVE